MRPIGARALVLLALLLPAAESRGAGGAGAEKPWLAGLYAGACGFSPRTAPPAAEYLAAGLFAEPLPVRRLNPLLSAGLLLPIAPFRPDAIYWQVGGELALFDLPIAGLKRRFYSSACWSPAAGAGWLSGPRLRPGAFSLLLAPLRLRAADGLFSFGELQVFLAEGARPDGWGLTLFKAAVFWF